MRVHLRAQLPGALAAAVAVVCLAAGALFAGNRDPGVPGGKTPVLSARATTTDRFLGAGNEAWEGFLDRHPGGWITRWDIRSHRPSLIYGPGIKSGRPAPDEAAASEIAFDLVSENMDLLGLRPFDLEGNPFHAGNTWYVDLGLVHQGIPLEEHSRVGFRIKDNGVVAAIRAEAIPASLEPPRPEVAGDIAIASVLARLGDGRPDLRPGEAALCYIDDADGVGRLAWRFEVRGADRRDPFGKEYFVHAGPDLRVLRVRELIRYDHSGDVAGNTVVGATNDPPVATFLQDARVTYTAGGSGSAFTDANGDFVFPGGSGTATIRSRLNGHWSDVNNQAGSDAEESITAGPGDNFHFFHNTTPSEFRTAETSGYYWTTAVHNWSSAIQGNNGVEYEIPTNVNIASTCNAFYDGVSINFFRAGDGCPNMAWDATVVSHEYGHGIDDGHGGILDGSYSEGYADSVANALTNQPCAGIDFFGPGTCLRNAENVRLWPAPECGGEVHCEGEIIAGHNWQMYLNLVATLGEVDARIVADQLILWADLANPASIPDAVLEEFIADDDDGDLDNGTPHFTEIAAAADSRNIPRPPDPLLPSGQCGKGGVNAGLHAPTPVFSDDMEGGVQPWWSHGADQGVDDWAVVTAPEAHSGTKVWFTSDPADVTDKHLDLTVDVVAPATELSFWHTYDFESHFDGGQLLVSTNGGASFTLLDSEILVGGYNGTFSTCCSNPAGGQPGWGDGTIGAMTEVVVDLSAYQGTGVVLRWRMVADSSVSNPGWEIDDVAVREPAPCDATRADVLFVNRTLPTIVFQDDMESGAQPWWSHGAPLGIDDWAVRTTSLASSPTHAWTCIDDTTYTDKHLDLTVDLGASATELRFMHTFFTENTFDGGNLSISTDGGASFTVLGSEILEGGYTGVISTSFGNPIGGQSAWTGGAFDPMSLVRVDLSAYAPATGAILRWRFGADSCCGPGSGGGWQIDDVTILDPGIEGTGDLQRTIVVSPDTPLSFVLDEPPSRVGDGQGTDACIYVWTAEPTESDVVVAPRGLGTMCFGVYSQPPTLLPVKIFNGIGAEGKLGPNNGGPNPPGIPEGGNFEFAHRAGGAGHPITVTIQGIIEDDCSLATLPFSVTNGVLLRVQ